MPFEEGTKTDLWGNEIKLPAKEDRWREVEIALNELYTAYYDRDASSVIPPHYRDEDSLGTRVEIALDRLMKLYDAWLE